MDYTREQLTEAFCALRSTLGKCEKVQKKLRRGTPQHTLTKRRIAALKVALDLIGERLEESQIFSEPKNNGEEKNGDGRDAISPFFIVALA